MSTKITYDSAAARVWLNSPYDGTDGYTVAENLGVADDDEFGYDADDCEMFVSAVDTLVAEASSAGLFGAAVSLHLTYDDGYDGGLVTVDFPSGLRLASMHLAIKHFTRDHSARGVDAAVAVLTAIAYEAVTVVEQLPENR